MCCVKIFYLEIKLSLGTELDICEKKKSHFVCFFKKSYSCFQNFKRNTIIFYVTLMHFSLMLVLKIYFLKLHLIFGSSQKSTTTRLLSQGSFRKFIPPNMMIFH